MAATISTFMVRCGSIYLSNKSKSYKEKLNIIGTHYSSLSSIKTVTVFTLNHLTTNDGIRCFKPLTSKESEAFRNFQADIQPNKTIEENFMVLLTKEFVEKQLQMIDALTIQGMNANPLLCSALNLNTIEDFIRFYAFQAVSRSMVTSMGYLVQDLLLYSNDNIFDGKGYPEGDHVKWDLVIEKLNDVRSFIEVKSGPNDIDKGQVISYGREIKLVEAQGDKGYFGITYGRKDMKTVSFGLLQTYIEDWEKKTLIGRDLWNYVADNPNYHTLLNDTIRATAETLIQSGSIMSRIDDKVNRLIDEFNNQYDSLQEYYDSLW